MNTLVSSLKYPLPSNLHTTVSLSGWNVNILLSSSRAFHCLPPLFHCLWTTVRLHGKKLQNETNNKYSIFWFLSMAVIFSFKPRSSSLSKNVHSYASLPVFQWKMNYHLLVLDSRVHKKIENFIFSTKMAILTQKYVFAQSRRSKLKPFVQSIKMLLGTNLHLYLQHKNT